MEGGKNGPVKGPAKSDKSNLENSAELKKSAELFCSTHISNDELKDDREKYVALAYDGKNPALNSYSMQMLEKDLRLPEEPSMMVWVGAPKSLQTHIIKEHPHVQNQHLSDAYKFKEQTVEKFRKNFSKDSWEILSKVSKGFWEVRIADFPVPDTKLPLELEKIKRQVKSARAWANNSTPSSKHTYPEALYSKVHGFNKPQDGIQFGEKLEEVYGAFIKHYATDPTAREKLFSELAKMDKSNFLKKGEYFDAIEEEFFSRHTWGEKVTSVSETKELLPLSITASLNQKDFKHYFAEINKSYEKRNTGVLMDYLKDHMHASWSSIAVLAQDSRMTGWIAGGRATDGLNRLMSEKFSEPMLEDMKQADQAFLRMPYQDFLTTLKDWERLELNAFTNVVYKDRFEESGGIGNLPMDKVLSEFRSKYGKAITEGTMVGFKKVVLAVQNSRAQFMEQMVGVNTEPFEQLERSLHKTRHMVEQAQKAQEKDYVTKRHFALNARMSLEEDFLDQAVELKKQGSIPPAYENIFKVLSERIQEDLSLIERDLRDAGV